MWIKCREILGRSASPREVLSWLLYPRVFQDFAAHRTKYGDVSVLPTPVFLEGPKVGEELAVDIEPGKTLVIRLLSVGEPHADGTRTVYAERDGKLAEVLVAPGTPVEAGELVVRYES